MAITNTTKRGTHDHPLESDLATMHPLISWRSVVAGFLIALFSMAGLIGLGIAFGGIGLEDGASLRGAGIFTGVWFIASALISLFLGSYFAARVSKFQTGRIGSAQGLVIAALFLGFFFYQALGLIGTAGQTAGTMVGGAAGAVGTGVERAAQSPAITEAAGNLVEDALGGLELRSDPQTVITGVATRLIQGNTESARNYLINQSNLTQAEADARINQLQTQMATTLEQVRDRTASALKSVGWSLFLLVLLGALSAVGGGALGSVANFRNPLSREQLRTQLV
jgi:hypothetical protein